jgi:hypothetical protein
VRKFLFLILVPLTIYSSEGKFGSETALGYSFSNPDLESYFTTHHATSWSDTVNMARFKTNYRAAIKNASVASSNGTFEFGYDRVLSPNWTLFAYLDVLYRLVSSMNTMTIVGSGAKYTSIRTSKVLFDTSLAPIYQREIQEDSSDISSLSFSLRNRITYTFVMNHLFIMTHFYTLATNNTQNQFHIISPQYVYTPTKQISVHIGHNYTYSLLTTASSGFSYLQVVFSF